MCIGESSRLSVARAIMAIAVSVTEILLVIGGVSAAIHKNWFDVVLLIIMAIMTVFVGREVFYQYRFKIRKKRGL